MKHEDYGRLEVKGNVATFCFDGVTMVYGFSELRKDFDKLGEDGFYKKYGFKWGLWF